MIWTGFLWHADIRLQEENILLSLSTSAYMRHAQVSYVSL